MDQHVKLLYNRLEHYKVTNPDKSNDRHNFCHLILFVSNRPHKFEVRGWTKTKDTIKVNAVNWTITAGTCTLVVDSENIHAIKILEDEPTIQVLYGYK